MGSSKCISKEHQCLSPSWLHPPSFSLYSQIYICICSNIHFLLRVKCVNFYNSFNLLVKTHIKVLPGPSKELTGTLITLRLSKVKCASSNTPNRSVPNCSRLHPTGFCSPLSDNNSRQRFYSDHLMSTAGVYRQKPDENWRATTAGLFASFFFFRAEMFCCCKSHILDARLKKKMVSGNSCHFYVIACHICFVSKCEFDGVIAAGLSKETFITEKFNNLRKCASAKCLQTAQTTAAPLFVQVS